MLTFDPQWHPTLQVVQIHLINVINHCHVQQVDPTTMVCSLRKYKNEQHAPWAIVLSATTLSRRLDVPDSHLDLRGGTALGLLSGADRCGHNLWLQMRREAGWQRPFLVLRP
jgi:hypothetical protein